MYSSSGRLIIVGTTSIPRDNAHREGMLWIERLCISGTTKFAMAEAVEKYVCGETESAIDTVLNANKESHVLLIYVRGNW